MDNSIIQDILNQNNLNEEFIDKTIYLIQYPEGELSVSYGILENIYENIKYNFIHKCSTRGGSSGSPILTSDNKLIDIHKEGNSNRYNKGLFLNYPLKEFIQIHYNNKLLLKKFNEKYNAYIKNNKTNKLVLGNRYIGNEGSKELSKIELKDLKELYLNSNDISDINILENAKFEKLEILDLGVIKYSI